MWRAACPSEARSVPHHAGRHGVLAVEDAAVGGRARSCSPQLGGDAMTGDEIGERLELHPRGDPRLPRRARRAAVPRARRRRAATARYRNTPETAAFLDKSEPGLHRRDPRDGQRAAVSILGRSHRGAADRRAPERDQAHRQADVRGALQRPGAARAVHERDGRDLARQLPRAGGEVRLLQVQDALRRRRRHRPALDHRRQPPPAPALHELRPAGRRADRRAHDRSRRADATA